jgi:hypothetical protein
MDADRFDILTRALHPGSRRQVFRLLVGSVLGSLFSVGTIPIAAKKGRNGKGNKGSKHEAKKRTKQNARAASKKEPTVNCNETCRENCRVCDPLGVPEVDREICKFNGRCFRECQRRCRSCAAGTSICTYWPEGTSACKDLTSDPSNCGVCGVACVGCEECINRTCRSACNPCQQCSRGTNPVCEAIPCEQPCHVCDPTTGGTCAPVKTCNSGQGLNLSTCECECQVSCPGGQIPNLENNCECECTTGGEQCGTKCCQDGEFCSDPATSTCCRVCTGAVCTAGLSDEGCPVCRGVGEQCCCGKGTTGSPTCEGNVYSSPPGTVCCGGAGPCPTTSCCTTSRPRLEDLVCNPCNF